jgi:hypothetical protein
MRKLSHIATVNMSCSHSKRDEPETFHFLATREHVPLHSEFKPALKVLSRKPAPKLIQKIDPVTGLASLALEDEEEEREVKVSATPDELRLRAQREREQKQKRYDEVRARIMGTPSGNSSPGTITPPSEGGRGKGRGRGSSRNDIQRPSLQSAPRELFDPNSTKPGLPFHKKSTELSRSGSSTPREDDQIIRTPRGPDGGNGFVNRSGKGS